MCSKHALRAARTREVPIAPASGRLRRTLASYMDKDENQGKSSNSRKEPRVDAPVKVRKAEMNFEGTQI